MSRGNNPYDNPEEFGLEVVATVEDNEPYQFDLVVLWRRAADGKLLWAADSGCSCPSPFEDLASVEGLNPLPETRTDLLRAIENVHGASFAATRDFARKAGV